MDRANINLQAAEIIRTGIFDVACYCAQAGRDLDLESAVEDYLLRGESQDLCPNDLFAPAHVRSQLAHLGFPTTEGTILSTYLAHPDAPINPHPLFDHAYYVREDSRLSGLEDYLRRRSTGAMLPNPNILFDRVYYYDRYRDVAVLKVDAFQHFVRVGWKENRQPHALFNSDYWRRSLGDTGAALTNDNPLVVYLSDRTTWFARTHPLFIPEHFSWEMEQRGLEPNSQYAPLADMLMRDEGLCVSGNRLFDATFYRRQAQRDGIDLPEHPIIHYVKQNGRGGLDPHPLFCGSYYLNRYRDVADAGLNPLGHFIETGQSEGRDPNPLFSQSYYRSNNPEVQSSETNLLLEHYLVNGSQLLNTHPLFEARIYAARHPDCLLPGDTPLAHYSRNWADQGLRFPPWGTALYPRRQAPREFIPPDVLLISHELTRTGAPAILLRIVQDLTSRRGLRTMVLAARGGELLEDFCEWTATVDVGLARNAGISEATFLARICASLSEYHKPQLAIVNTACVDSIGIALAEAEIPVITLVHELASAFAEKTFQNIYSSSHLVIYPAEFVRNEAHMLYALPADKTAVIPQGLLNPEFGKSDPQQARQALLEEISAAPEAFIVLGCGTLDLRKGLDAFVHVARATVYALEANQSRGPVHFVWVGGGPQTPHSVCWYTRQDIDRSGMADRIHLLGPRSNTESYFVGCDAFIVTSRMDPFPCVIHEAMACAKPIIAFADSGGAAEALADGAGITVPYGDIAAMADEIRRLEIEPDRAQDFGARARAVVHSRYVFRDYVDRILSRAQEATGVEFPEPIQRSSATRDRRRVIVACGDSESREVYEFTEFLVGGLLEKGFDAEFLFTTDVRASPKSGCLPAVPYRFLASRFSPPLTYKDRWEALERILNVAAPAVLIPNIDLIASAMAPVMPPGTGILGIVHSEHHEYLEHIARVGRYWQRAVATSQPLAERVVDAVPSLRDRIDCIPRAIREYAAPEARNGDSPLRIVSVGQRPRGGSAMPFLLPLVRQLQAAQVKFTLTVVDGGPEGQLLKTVADKEIADGIVRVPESLTAKDVPELLSANDVLLLLSSIVGGTFNVAEAMAAGLSVLVASPDEAAVELVQDGVHGYRLGACNVRLCVTRLRQLAEDRALLDRLRIAAHETGRRAPCAPQVCDSYATVLDAMFAELRSGTYQRPAPLYVHPVIGGLSIPPLFLVDPGKLGFP